MRIYFYARKNVDSIGSRRNKGIRGVKLNKYVVLGSVWGSVGTGGAVAFWHQRSYVQV